MKVTAQCNPGANLDSWSSLPNAAGWFTSGRSSGAAHESKKPGATYSKRSAKLAQLRADAAALARLDFEDTAAPTANALRTAQDFLNNLWEGCLDFTLAISHDGEINFLYGDEGELFHIHIDEDGAISFYEKLPSGEKTGDSLAISDFPFADLLHFADRKK